MPGQISSVTGMPSARDFFVTRMALCQISSRGIAADKRRFGSTGSRRAVRHADAEGDVEVMEMDRQWLTAPDTFSFMGDAWSRPQIDNVRIFERLLGPVGLRRGEQGGEVGRGSAVLGMGAGFDLVRHDAPAPAVGQGRSVFTASVVRVWAAWMRLLTLRQQGRKGSGDTA